MSLNSSEYELYRKLKKIPLSELLEILSHELGNGPYLEYTYKGWRPTLLCWKILRRNGWTSEEFMNEPITYNEVNR